MKRSFTLLISLLLIFQLRANDKQTIPGNLYALYHTLDSLIECQNDMVARKCEDIENITASLSTKGLSLREKYQINNRLYQEYVSFQYDSACAYIDRNMIIAEKLGDKYLYTLSMMNKVHTLSLSGLLSEAYQIIETIDTTYLNRADMVNYYKLLDDYYLYKAEFADGTPYSPEYIHQSNLYRLKVLEIAVPGSYQYIITKAPYLCYLERLDEAKSLLKSYLPQLKPGTREYSVVTSILAFDYGKPADIEIKKYYLALSAISDLMNCNRETTSIRVLAGILFQEGKTDMAYRYLNVSINDANYYNSRLRNLQSSKLIPLITMAYKYEQEAQQQRLKTTLIFTISLSVILIIGLIVSFILLKKLRRAKSHIAEVNSQLNNLVVKLEKLNSEQMESNSLLQESSKIKDEYIGRFLELTSSYIDIMSKNRKNLNKLAASHKLPDLYTELKSSSLIDDCTANFYQNFDMAFLNIYPNFVDSVNALLPAEEKIEPKSGERLTTELRIFALIRLGITDSQKIADILRSSITTIYTYRSKIKNRSLYKNDFENKIMEIGSFS